jgi:hypothetical protein
MTLLSESGLDGDTLAPLGAAPGKHSLAALGLHPAAKAVLLAAAAAVGLKCALRHEKSRLLVRKMTLGQTSSIADGKAGRQCESDFNESGAMNKLHQSSALTAPLTRRTIFGTDFD